MSTLFRFRVSGGSGSDDGGAPAASARPASISTAASDKPTGSVVSARPVGGLAAASKATTTTPVRGSSNGSSIAKPTFQPASRTPTDSSTPLQMQFQSTEAEKQKVTAWQNEMDTLEQTQMQIQTDQMNLLHSQIHILTRELGDLQKNFAFLLQKVEDDGAEVNARMDDLQANLEEAVRVSHAALRLDLAEHGKNADELKAAMEEAHNALSQSVEAGFGNMASEHARAFDGHVSNMSQMEASIRADLQKMSDDHSGNIASLNDAHNERHAQNAAAFESSLQSAIEGTHTKLQADLAELRSGHTVSHESLKDILTDVTKQVDNLAISLEQEHELRLAVDKKIDSMVLELRDECATSLQNSHAALKLELAEHTGSLDQINGALEEAQEAFKNDWMQSHSALRDELMAHANDHYEKHQNVIDMVNNMNQEHHEKHATNEQRMEDGLQNVLEQTHGKLQEEMRLLKSGGSGSLKDLSKILVDVTQQVDTLDQAVQKEHELRMAVETKLDQILNDQDSAISQLREEMGVALHESHAALKLELAEHGRNADEVKAAMADAHAALKDELVLHQQNFDDFNKAHGDKMADLEAQMRGDLQSVRAEHQEVHSMNAKKLEDGLSNMLGGAHAKLKEELQQLQGGGSHNVDDLSRILTEVTQQVDNLDQAVQKEHELRMAVESKMDQLLNEQDVVMCQLKDDVNVAIHESHAALKLELAELSNNSEEVKTAMSEAQAALKEELDGHRQSIDEMHGQLRSDMQAMNCEHHEKHAMNSQAIEDGLNNVLEGTHAKLQEEMRILKGGGATDVSSLNKILTDVTQQVDNLEQAMQAEHELRLATETKMDQMFNDQDVVVCQLKEELKVAMHEAHAALKLELAELGGKNSEEVKAAMVDAHAALRDELNLHRQTLEDHANTHGAKLGDLESQLRDDMTKISEEHHEKHALNAKNLEDGINNVLGGAHAKLQEELRVLKTGGGGSLQGLSKIMADVTQQVDKIDQAVSKEHELRMAVEAKVDQMLSDQDATLCKLKDELDVALHESHAALKLELAEHGGKREELEAAMADAHAALKDELGLHKQSLEEHSKTHGENFEKLEAQLKRDLQKVNDDHDYKHQVHAQKYDGLESGLHNVLTSTHAKLQQDLKNMSDGHFNLSEMLTDVTKQVDTLTLAVDREHDLRIAVESRLEEVVGEYNQSHEALRHEHSQIAGDLTNQLQSQDQAIHGKHASIQAWMEQRIQLLEQAQTDNHNHVFKELQGTHAKIQDLYGHLHGTKSRSELVSGSFDERIAFLERQVNEKTEAHNAIHAQLRGEALAREKNLSAVETRIAKAETFFTELTDRHAEAISRLDQSRLSGDQHRAITEQRLAALDRAVLESADNQSHAINAVRMEHGQFLQAERNARESYEKTFLDYINDARAQKEVLEAATHEQFRVERHQREMHVNQLKDAMAQQLNNINWQGESQFTDMLLQERSSREAAERALERRIETYERSLQMERNERSVELTRIWEAFDGHTHEAMSPIVKEVPGTVRSLAPMASTRTLPSTLTSPRSAMAAKILSEAYGSSRVEALNR